MATMIMNYDSLTRISGHVSNLAKAAEEYSNNLEKSIKFDSLTNGATNNTSMAQYYVKAKVQQLRNKKSSYDGLSVKITSLVQNARRVDDEVARDISLNKNTFLEKNEHLRIGDWKASILNWLVDLKNKCPIFNIIGNAIRILETGRSTLKDNIRHWYRCEGGREALSIVLAVAGVIASLLLLVATFPLSGFVSFCAIVSACIGVLNATANLTTSIMSMSAKRNGDPAWAKIYGDRNTLSDVFRQQNFGSGFWNKLSYGAATTLDCVQLFCDAVNIIHMAKNLMSKLSCIKNYFGKNTGLLSYCKTAKWTDGPIYDEWGRAISTEKVMLKNEFRVIETRFTPSSIWRGAKAYVMNKPIDCRSEQGIRTLLNQNFKIDFKCGFNFSFAGFKDTFKYKVTNGGAISFSEWKSSFSLAAIKDTIRYNIKFSGLKHSSLKGIFASGIKWKNRKIYVKATGVALNSAIKITEKSELIIIGKSDLSKEIEGLLFDKIKKSSEITKLIDKINSFSKKSNSTFKNTYNYKSANAST